MIFKEPSRPFDPTATSPLNLVVGEKQTVGEENSRLFIPSIGPYYMESLIVYDGTEVLTLDRDYSCYILHTRATKATRKPVACCIKITKPGVTEVTIDYQVVGGQYEYVLDVVQEMLTDNKDKVLYPIYWKNILEKPETFNPASHMHGYWEFDGWGILNTPTDQILQSILYRKKEKTEAVFQYLHSRMTAFENKYNTRIGDMLNALNVIRANIVEPLNTLVIRTDNVSATTLRDGTWRAVEDKVLMSGSRSTIGETVQMSSVIVYPQPDNTLLAEDDTPIVTDETEWMYLDNRYPVLPGEEEDYGKLYDTEFTLYNFKGWVKKARGAATSQELLSNRTSVTEGGSVTFTVTTTGYVPGDRFPYQLTGVGATNVDVPLIGYMTINDNGIATLTVTLIDGGPQTDLSVMQLKVLTLTTLTKSVTYTLRSNERYRAKTYATTGYNTIKLDTLVMGDQFYLVIQTAGLKGKELLLNLKSRKGTHQFSAINGDLVGTDYKVKVADDGEELYVKIQSTQKDMIDPEALDVLVKYGAEVLDEFSVPATLMTFTVGWRALETMKEVTEISDGQRFVLEVKHNSRQTVLFNVLTLNNPYHSVMVSEIPPTVVAAFGVYGRSGHIEFDRLDKSVAGAITVRVSSTLTVVQSKDLTINVPAVVTE